MHYVYILRLNNGTYYSGITKNLVSRYEKHYNGAVLHTKKFRPIKKVWYAAFINIELARSFEKYLKSSSGKSFRNKHLI